ncbi:hypothetical protein Taro_006005 [Colocasia esculenta]|uniref:Uncharacterized protein n=1 Tax=Colocasia esculenta TaxID=4460 RepID=A0A843TPX1_COLES|nr:hypothetical protein [Colocasia esculenta]
MEPRKGGSVPCGQLAGGCMGRGRRRPSSTEKLVAIGLTLLAIASPLYVDRTPPRPEEEEEESEYGSSAARLLPAALVVLILATISFASFFDSRYTRFDPYWIHRVGGSSAGIVALLLLLALVLKVQGFVCGEKKKMKCQ